MLYEIKNNGETMDQFIKRVKDKHKITKLGYTARLDPMAKGIVPFVIGDNCLNIKDYLGSNKIYQVKIILGIKTDSDDPLGIITERIKITNDNYKKIIESVIDYIKLINNSNFNQRYHYFSTKMLNHRRNKITEKETKIIDYHKVSLQNFEKLKEGKIDYKKWKNKIIEQIKSIDKSRNFRQEQTINQWNELDMEELYYIKLRLSVSSGFFIRQLVKDISDYINIPLMAYNINRTSCF